MARPGSLAAAPHRGDLRAGSHRGKRLGHDGPRYDSVLRDSDGPLSADLELIDRYLLGEPVSKPDVVAAILANRSDAPAAAPFYRAFEAVGARAADEAFVALRLVLAGRDAEDSAVRRLRALARVARAHATGDRPGLARALKSDASELADIGDSPREPDALAAAVRAAYRKELGA